MLLALASILVTIQLAPFATKIVDGNIDDLNAALYELLAKIDFSAYVNKSIIIKAVRKAVPTRAYVLAAIIYNPMPVALCTAKLAQPFRYTTKNRDELKTQI
jgi:hypothetical protein